MVQTYGVGSGDTFEEAKANAISTAHEALNPLCPNGWTNSQILDVIPIPSGDPPFQVKVNVQADPN